MIHYDAETGIFLWREDRGGLARSGFEAGRVNASGYREIMIDGLRYPASHLAFVITTGQWPRHLVDHINGDRADNRFANLREATLAQNARNSVKPANNTSGLKGVTWKRQNQRWCAQLSVDNRKIHLGLFDTPEAAHAAYAEAAKIHHGEFARAS